ncbi:hypothetical protein C5B91_08400 [Haloferax sp. Atlit-10N]|uniref:DUF5305 domain-containing protein n=1 Tax=Haloferax prahovense (strain DSM 18310 / JCM 13924 / TL6) TaxID=1227461 RepID=M0G0R4_HALPT|nr:MULTISPECIES: DUF5305 domain-containing protein [Haloferax]ELZ65097.1 hypothetical protein C457_16387 [Haloferax prahovense DSM 18310]RDZ44984.1 hypothetical protein C5B87_12570 [Haloferax sp. Atlit-16N]RDZ48336.1 hypothetical protein C5B86_04635 [Haloferax sp. Atlit-19N]RDZ59239.1 hypothetical protein C5B91_08400 [Haloferax sp. Atlit-10N]
MGFDDRLELFVTQQARVLVAVLAIAGVACLVAAGYVFLTPTTQTVTEETNVQSVETGVDTRAVVTQNTTLYERGSTLENRSVYFMTISPDVSFRVHTDVPANQSVNVTQQLVLRTVGVRDGTPFYENETVLLDEQTLVTDGTVVDAPSLNVSTLDRDLQQKRTETGGVGQFRTSLNLTVTYQTGSYSGTLEASTPLAFSGRAYYLERSLADDRRHSTTVARTVTRPPNPVEYGGLAAAALVLFGLAGLVIRTEYRSDPEELRTRISHSRHEEWISRGEFPTDANKPYISILTLEDLVDVAIDTNRRVIFDPEIETYAVIDSSEIYYYSLDETNTHAWLNL